MRLFIPILLICFLISCLFSCTESGTTTPEKLPENASEYYPGNIGSRFTYSLDTLSESGEFDNIGNRITIFENSEIYDSVRYINQKNSYSIGSNISEGKILFRTSERGIYFAADSNLIGDLLSDPIIQSLGDDIKIDQEANIFSTPIVDERTWRVFKINLLVEDTFEFNLLELQSSFGGQETLQFEDNTETVKLRYRLIIINPLDISSFQEYYAEGWFGKDIGIVQLEGNALIVNALSGAQIELRDTSRTLRQTLLNYSIIP